MCWLQYEQCVDEAMRFLGLVQRKAADCQTSQDALHLIKELDSFQAELAPSQQRRIDDIKLLTKNRGRYQSNLIHWTAVLLGRVVTRQIRPYMRNKCKTFSLCLTKQGPQSNRPHSPMFDSNVTFKSLVAVTRHFLAWKWAPYAALRNLKFIWSITFLPNRV